MRDLLQRSATATKLRPRPIQEHQRRAQLQKKRSEPSLSLFLAHPAALPPLVLIRARAYCTACCAVVRQCWERRASWTGIRAVLEPRLLHLSLARAFVSLVVPWCGSAELADIRRLFTDGLHQSDVLVLLCSTNVLMRPWCECVPVRACVRACACEHASESELERETD